MTAEPIVELRAELGEGPVWDVNQNRLIWVDIPNKEILTTNPSNGQTESVSTPSEVGAVALADSGDYVAALEDGLYIGDGVAPWRLLAPIEATEETTRMNDGKCDPYGAYVGGTLRRDGREGTASLYRVEHTGATQVLLGGLSISNGLDWTDDGTTMYHIDTPTRAVMAYSYDPAALGQSAPVVEIPPEQGFPDGMTLDSEGCLWVGLWGGRAVHRYTPDGRLDTMIDLPVTNVTSCAFGGDDLETLFITTASPGPEGEKLAAEPLAGALFAVDIGVSGRLPTLFRTAEG